MPFQFELKLQQFQMSYRSNINCDW